ncbi:metallophosphoesterase [Bacillus alkalicellulosilyticus]|uniref:metallophosphoesterase n=1 Tax=Alkalihalobacterium alkalicellulosilyticum TaxID=1912214 RepID=UPI0009974511|nr:metallophosphoesterase [Bacillus alkalicellulosilyticus]
MKQKYIRKKSVIFWVLLSVFVIYTVWDNNRIIVVEEEIFLPHLPEAFDGYTMLQVTDLHEKEFGKNQHRLISLINSLEYDAILFTGDMLDNIESTNFSPYYTLIEGVKNKETALYVAGNADPLNYTLSRYEPNDKSAFVQGMEERGVSLLESIFTVEKEGASLNFVDFDLVTTDKKWKETVFNNSDSSSEYKTKLQSYEMQLLEEISSLEETIEQEPIIALSHYPIVDVRIDYLEYAVQHDLPAIDLIIAGHYHGGQIRIPFWGALFVPEPWYERSGLFPPRDRVKGLWEYKGIQQYVSAGLGSSDAIPLLKFRVFNPPEINLITLKKAE